MSKKNIAVFCLILFLITSATLFFSEKNSEEYNEEKVTKSDSYILRFGHNMPVNSAQHQSAVRFAEVVKYKTKGKVEVKIFPDQQLGTDQEMIEMARRGELDILLPPTAKMTTLISELQLLDLPYLCSSREELYDLLDGEIGKILLEKLKPHGLIGASFWESGFKQFTANKEIHSPSDFQGLNVRVMKSKVIMDQFKAFGANPIPIDLHKTYQALKDGIVVAEETPLSSIVNLKFYQIQSHLIISNHAYFAQAFVFSRKVFESLPSDIREILFSTAVELATFQRKEVAEREVKYLKTIIDYGTNIHKLTLREQKEFKKISKSAFTKFREVGGDILDKTYTFLSEKEKERDNQIIVGLNADLRSSSSLSGLSIKRGMEIAIEDINKSGGVLGKKLKLIAMDNSGINVRGINNMKLFSKKKNLAAVVCGIYSPVALAELPIIHKEKIIFLDPWAAATGIVSNGYKPNYVFRVSVRDEYAGPFLVKQALKKHKKIALLLVNDGWGRSNHKAITESLAKRKLKPVTIEWFNWGESNMTEKLNRIEKAGAEVIIIVAGNYEGIKIIKGMAKRATQIPIISHWGITGGNFWKEVQNELEHVSLKFLQSFSFLNPKNRKTKELIRKYYIKYNIDHPGKIVAPVGTAHAYDLVHLLAIAIKKTKKLDRTLIRNSFEKIKKYEGVVKTYAPPFTKSNHDALDVSSFFLARFNEKGYIIPVGE
ncbi:MAG: DctP family TRAP transporter solute-binding subunit [Desulfobacterales bacterium]|nr:DctP family TRAP transporter solute-binding subunit [Desulfobacterales bacterium]